MTTGQAVTVAITQALNISDEDQEQYPVADDAQTRVRALRYLQEALDWWWVQKDWDCRKSSFVTTCTIGANNDNGDIDPSGGAFGDFDGCGEDTTVYVQGERRELARKDLKIVERQLQLVTNPGMPRIYCAKPYFINDDDAGVLKRWRLKVAPMPSVDTILEISDFLVARPLLVDEAISGNPIDGTSLVVVPEKYHLTAMLAYVIFRLKDSEGDVRAPGDFAQLKQAVNDGWRDENPQNVVVYTPRYGRGSR